MLKTTEQAPPKKKFRIATSISLVVSVCVHAAIFLVVGGVVIFEGKLPQNMFESAAGGFIDESPAVEMEMPPMLEEEMSPEVMDDMSESESLDAPAEMTDFTPDVISSTLTSTTFSLPKPMALPTLTTGMASSRVGGTGGQGASKGGPGVGKIKMGSLFGSRNLGGGALTGYLYDFKQDRKKESTSVGVAYQGNGKGGTKAYAEVLDRFIKNWDEAELEDYFRSDDPLSITQFVMPQMNASEAPKAFEVEKNVKPSGWMINYSGKMSPPHTGTFRFAGLGDDVLIVRVDGKVVFDGSWSHYSKVDGVREKIGKSFTGSSMWGGKWIKLRSGQTYTMEVIFGEVPGGKCSAFLLVQDKDENYEQHLRGYPILPVFQMLPTEIPKYSDKEGFRVLEDGLVFGVE